MITLRQPADLTWEVVEAVAYDHARLEIDEPLLVRVEQGRADFLHLIDQGVPCYGVTTGLGALANTDLTDAERADLPHNMLRARAAAIGPPLPKPVARATLVIRLVNFLSGLDGVSADLCRFVAARLNDDCTPWIPGQGHGIAADVTANCHAFQTFIGEGFIFGPDNHRQPAAEALAARGVEPYRLGVKEGLALLSGVTTAPAYALDAYRCLERQLRLATMVAAVSMEGLAAPKDAVDPALAAVSAEPGVGVMIAVLQRWLAGSRIEAVKFQAPVSYRVTPQVHGAMFDALQQLGQRIERGLVSFTDNPLMVRNGSIQGGRLLSVGLFHNQHLVNQVEQVALALAHVGCLSERRLHRLLNPTITGLPPQLAARPGLDAGLVVAHKASLGLAAHLRLLAQPISLATGDSSGGQEDYMALTLPAIARLYDMADLVTSMLAYELLAGLTALDQRGGCPGDGVEAVRAYVRQVIPPLEQDRSPGPDVEQLRQMLDSSAFRAVLDIFG